MQIIDRLVEGIYQGLSGTMPSGYIAPLAFVLFVIVCILIVKEIIHYIRMRGNLIALGLLISGFVYFIYLYYE